VPPLPPPRPGPRFALGSPGCSLTEPPPTTRASCRPAKTWLWPGGPPSWTAPSTIRRRWPRAAKIVSAAIARRRLTLDLLPAADGPDETESAT
jgi:hypothetical protein